MEYKEIVEVLLRELDPHGQLGDLQGVRLELCDVTAQHRLSLKELRGASQPGRGSYGYED